MRFLAAILALIVLWPVSMEAGLFKKKPKKPVAKYGMSREAQRRRADKAKDMKWKRIEQQYDAKRKASRTPSARMKTPPAGQSTTPTAPAAAPATQP